MPSDLTIRAMRAPADYDAVADLLTRCGDTVTAADLAGQDAAMPPHGALSTDDDGRLVGHDRVRYVCPGDGGLVGYAVAWRAPWTPAGVVASAVSVDPRQHAGAAHRALLEGLHSWASRIGAEQIMCEVADHDEAGLRLLAACGYRSRAHVCEATAPIPADAASAGDTHATARGPVRLTSIADEPAPGRAAELYQLYLDTLPDNPGHIDSVPAFDDWRREVLDGDGCRPDWLFLALHDDRVVGVCHLRTTDDPYTAHNDYTAVARAWRGHGIARALKLHAAGQAARSGIRSMRTEVEAANRAMLAVNDRLGYQRGRGHHRMVRTCGCDAGESAEIHAG
ncbi:GNAT family N-acetyltransferase [Dactylosporangium sp. NPDC049742]|uniref:GNAT family N-acetyltransferase n=1 Tax=Dactylosporangium sp. NPDC049742 TaxID=3154737 RepID=UPI00342AF59C